MDFKASILISYSFYKPPKIKNAEVLYKCAPQEEEQKDNKITYAFYAFSQEYLIFKL